MTSENLKIYKNVIYVLLISAFIYLGFKVYTVDIHLDVIYFDQVKNVFFILIFLFLIQEASSKNLKELPYNILISFFALSSHVGSQLIALFLLSISKTSSKVINSIVLIGSITFYLPASLITFKNEVVLTCLVIYFLYLLKENNDNKFFTSVTVYIVLSVLGKIGGLYFIDIYTPEILISMAMISNVFHRKTNDRDEFLYLSFLIAVTMSNSMLIIPLLFNFVLFRARGEKITSFEYNSMSSIYIIYFLLSILILINFVSLYSFTLVILLMFIKKRELTYRLVSSEKSKDFILLLLISIYGLWLFIKDDWYGIF